MLFLASLYWSIFLITHPSNMSDQFAFKQVAGWLTLLVSLAGQHNPYLMLPTCTPGPLVNPLRYLLFLGHLDQVALFRLSRQSAQTHWVLKLASGSNISSTMISWMANTICILYTPLFNTSTTEKSTIETLWKRKSQQHKMSPCSLCCCIINKTKCHVWLR